MNLVSNKKIFFFNILYIFIIFILDRISKIYVIDFFNKSLDENLLETKFLNIHLIWNEGIAFGLMSFDEKNFYNLLTIVIIFVSLFILYFSYRSSGIQRYALLTVFGGSVGNLYDRIFYNAVPDFIDFHINEFHWFIFNIADVFITLGVIIMIMTEFFGNSNQKT